MHFSVCDFVLDIVHNAVQSEASHISLTIVQTGRDMEISVEDNGKGMTRVELDRSLDPFYTDGIKHKGRTVGLGLPFLKQAVEASAGSFDISSEKGRGTKVSFRFPLDNIDTPPIGDVPGTLLQALCLPGNYEMVVRRAWGNSEQQGEYILKRSEIKAALDGDFTSVASLKMLRSFLEAQETELVKEHV